MARLPGIVAALFTFALAWSASPAAAQSAHHRTRLDSAERAELTAIDAEAHTARDIYLASLGLGVAGAGIAGLSAFGFIGSFSPSNGASIFGLIGSIVGAGLAGLAILLLPFAIGLDVDSGSRRTGFGARVHQAHARRAAVQLTGGPADVGAGIAIVF